MTQEEMREQVIQNLSEMMRTMPFTWEFKAKKKPQGIKIIVELTQEQLNAVTKQAAERHKAMKES